MGLCRIVAAGVFAASVAFATVPGFAATVGGVTAKKLGAGKAIVAACDPDGLTVDYTTSTGSVTAVSIGGIADPGCEGGALALVVANVSGTSVGAGSGTVPTDAGTVDNTISISLSPTPAAGVVSATHVVITGP